MTQAIVTKRQRYRLTATASAGQVVVDWNTDRTDLENHTAGARALAIKLLWDGTLFCGALPNSPDSRVFVWDDGEPVRVVLPEFDFRVTGELRKNRARSFTLFDEKVRAVDDRQAVERVRRRLFRLSIEVRVNDVKLVVAAKRPAKQDAKRGAAKAPRKTKAKREVEQ